MTAPTVALDTDIGEGFGVWGLTDEGPLLDQVSAANIACGFHAGDPDIIRRTCTMAAERGVSIGAQVSYRDLAGFGRRFIDVPTPSLTNDLVYQIGALQAFARIAGTQVTYVKAHGALYNVAAHHEGHARAIVDAVRLVDPTLPVLCQYGTELWRLLQDAGLSPCPELFVDRAYTGEGLLVSRGRPGAVLTDPAAAADRAVRMIVDGVVESIDAETVSITPPAGADLIALCVHSDTPGALDIARETRERLLDKGITISTIGGTS
ncbi:MAG: 5-oxoprolinase subunit PxpA [Rhodococcus sp. (in: high G+C Gram-positive bacteria)]